MTYAVVPYRAPRRGRTNWHKLRTLFKVLRKGYQTYNYYKDRGLRAWGHAGRQYENMMNYEPPAFPSSGVRLPIGPRPKPGRNAHFAASKGGAAWYDPSQKGPFYKPSTLLYKGVQIDQQESVTHGGARVQYFGHYTHPHRAVIATICAALAKQLGYLSIGDTPSSLQRRFLTDTFTTNTGYRIELRYRNEPVESATMQFIATSFVDATTYMGVAVIIRDLFYQVFTNTANTQDVYLDYLILQQIDETVTVGQAVKAAPVIIKLADVSVVVDGTSRLKYQNVTLSDNLGSPDTHDVEANPLEGLEYNFKGSTNVLRHTTNAALQGCFTVSGNSGIGYFDSAIYADATVDTILDTRPNPRVFSKRTTSRSVRMQPGILSTSVIRSTHEMKLQKWLKMYSRAMQGSAAADTGGAEKAYVGASRWFAVDKMIHDSGDGQTIINLEVELSLKAKLNMRPHRTPTAPYNALT